MSNDYKHSLILDGDHFMEFGFKIITGFKREKDALHALEEVRANGYRGPAIIANIEQAYDNNGNEIREERLKRMNDTWRWR